VVSLSSAVGLALGRELAAAADADGREDDLAIASFVISSMTRGTLCFTEMLPDGDARCARLNAKKGESSALSSCGHAAVSSTTLM